MEISFKCTKLEKLFNEGKQLERKYGTEQASRIKRRLTELRAAECLNDLGPPMSGPPRCHELNEGQRKRNLSVDLKHPYRLIFIPNHEPIPEKSDGGLDWIRVTAITILGVEDTHG